MNKKLLAEITLLPAAVDIEAKAGDQIMMFNGVVVGVYTGREETPVKKLEKVLAGKAGGQKKAENAADPEKRRRVNATAVQREKWRKAIPEILRAHPEITIQEIAAKLHVKRGTQEYIGLGSLIRHLVYSGAIANIKRPNGGNIGVKYRLAA
jgi:hypothetical protein